MLLVLVGAVLQVILRLVLRGIGGRRLVLPRLAGGTGLRRLAALLAAYRLAAALPTSGGELAVIDHPAQQAYAVPGHPGRIVVSTGVLRGLNAGERRAVLAHERAHLTHRHHLHHTVAHLAAAANPSLIVVLSRR